ncbi:MAG: glycosyltransferase family 2 protein [bacterium]|nr:glycosyltransferase family 2 protein [bacterium]
MRPCVSIVIPSWNRKDLVEACLASLDEQTFRAFEVVVVDDGSTDGTDAYVRESHPDARLVVLPRNQGFCAATNAGIGAASCELVLLLNNDMTLKPDFLERLVDAADKSDAAMFAPLVLFRDEPEIIYSAGDEQQENGRPQSIGFKRRLDGFRYPSEIFGVSAGAGLYRREVFEGVGRLDPWFKAYFEDSDLSFRARLAGFRAHFVCDAVAYHIGSASLEGRTLWRTRQCCRNHVILTLKNMPMALLFRHARSIAAERLHQNRRVWTAARCEMGAWNAMWYLLGTWGATVAALPHALIARLGIQRRCAVTADELDDMLTREGRYP